MQKAKSMILYTMGIATFFGVDNVLAVANLAMLTGNIGKPSSALTRSGGKITSRVRVI